MANGRCCCGIFTFFVCPEGLERYFSQEAEGHLIVWFVAGVLVLLSGCRGNISLSTVVVP